MADAGADYEVVVARRQPHMPGKGIVLLGPVKGAKAQKAANAAGLRKAADVVALRVEAPNKPGECQRITALLSEAGINLRGLASTVIGRSFATSLVFDTDAESAKAARQVRAAG